MKKAKKLIAVLMTAVFMLTLPVFAHAAPKTATVEGFSVTYNAYFKSATRVKTYLNAYKASGSLPDPIIAEISVTGYDLNNEEIPFQKAQSFVYTSNELEMTAYFDSTVTLKRAHCEFSFLGVNLSPIDIMRQM